MVDRLQELLEISANRHLHLCPRQVLGVRMGMFAGKVLGLVLPQEDKRLFTFAESDGCGTGGISVATGCWVDRRTLHVVDYGKLAAVFVDTETGKAVRVKPHPDSRLLALQFAPDEVDAWHSQLAAYQIIPDKTLLVKETVRLTVDLEKIISLSGMLAICNCCGEEITNQREVIQGGQTLCRGCAGSPYYTTTEKKETLETLPISQNKEETAPGKNSGRTIPVVTLTGKSGNGKTTLMERMVRELCHRGYRVATVKHHSHAGFEIDYPGKDSWRHAQAGSRYVVIASPDKIASYRLLERELELDEILPEISAVDIILVEGYRDSKKPTIEVFRSKNSRELVGDPEQWIAVATDTWLDVSAPQYDLDDYTGLVDLVARTFLNEKGAGLPASYFEFQHLYPVKGGRD